MKIALLGAESTGKSQLALALSAHLRNSGLAVHHVGEYLREWCDTHQRTPTQDEQHHIVQTQIARVMATPADTVVIADTTPLMTAVYSQLLFNDHSHDDLALVHQALFDVTLLTGLDLAWVSDGLQRDGPHVREPVDQKVRHMLSQANLPYQVVYGSGPQRLENALFCMGRQAPQWAKQLARQESPTRWSGLCETCGNGDCEHRLFTGLLVP
ncbi:ATP-binding protein [Limnohabitans sp.]|uniref:ATP-binding protein n=1 Tax=Limnohabitans sp. TaxID=1907725 RepID=UPI00286F2530|nr:ATP-binding protein [Limnohabitans sp.]